MIRLRNLAASLLAICLLAGCVAYSAVEPTKKRDIGGVFRVEPATTWSALKSGNSEHWTINGLGLEAISFVTKVTDGEPISPDIQGDKAPTFRAGMNAFEVVDLYEAYLSARGYSQVEMHDLHPVTISGIEAFRFEFSAYNPNGLAKRAIVVGLIDVEKGLNLAIYEAASEHYYDASLAVPKRFSARWRSSDPSGCMPSAIEPGIRPQATSFPLRHVGGELHDLEGLAAGRQQRVVGRLDPDLAAALGEADTPPAGIRRG